MYSWQNMRDIMSAKKFDPITFKNQFHEEFMFIRETSLVDRDQFCAEIDELMTEGKNNIPFDDMGLIHENRHVTEWRWEEGSELVTHVCMKKRGRAWRSIVYRETIEDFQDTFS